MIPTLPLEDAVVRRAPAWSFAPRARHAGSAVKSRNAFYGAAFQTHPGIAVQWSPQHCFEQVAARANLHCAEGEVDVWISRAAAFPQASFSLVSVLPDLPQELRCAALEELLGDLLRHWAATHGLTPLSVRVDAVHASLTPAQRQAFAFCKVSMPGQQITLLAAASSPSSGVHARLGRAARIAAPLLSCTTRVSLRTPLLHLSVAAARTLAAGDGLDLGEPGPRGLRLLAWTGDPGRTWGYLNWKGNRMSIDHTAAPGEEPSNLDGVAEPRDTTRAAPAPAGRVDHLSLRLSVEVASLNVPIGEMALWRAGHVLKLDLPLDSAAVSLLIDDRVVGRGQIVALDDRLAVEVTEWSLTPPGPHAV